MTDALKLAEQQLLSPGGLDQTQLEQVLTDLMGPAVDAGDLYFQSASHESWLLEDGLVRSGTHSVEQGVGIRAISGEKTGFAYADEILMPALLQASVAARAIARHGQQGAERLHARVLLDRVPEPVLRGPRAHRVDDPELIGGEPLCRAQ